MGFNQIVKTHIQPSIKLIELSDYDNSNNSESFIKKNEAYGDFSQIAGKLIPFVKIGGQLVTQIDSLVINESGFIPTLDLIFTDENGEFAGNYFPKRNLIVSVFISPANPKFKPVRSDYLITNIKSIPVKNRGTKIDLSTGVSYIIKAELFVPRLYNNISKGYQNMTSVDALKKVCRELKLGFAQNEFTPSDSMTWVNINTSPANFIKEILKHAYQDDESFFSGFISKELILNMINVNEQLKMNESTLTYSTTSDSLLTSLTQKQKNDGVQDAINSIPVLNFLTNRRANANKSNYIYEANLISDHGSILKSEGYKKKIYYYDHLESDESKKKKDFFTIPLNTDGLSEASMLIPEDEGLDEIGNKKWIGIDYGNTHENWNAAKVFNSHNLKELEKIKLKVLLKGINFQVIRGMSIPVIITQTMAEKIAKETNPGSKIALDPDNVNPEEETFDTQLTGWYYVKEAKYIFDPNDPHQFITELILARREWSPSKITFTANA